MCIYINAIYQLSGNFIANHKEVMSMYVHIWKYMYIQTYIHVYIHSSRCTHTQCRRCAPKYIHLYIYIYTHTMQALCTQVESLTSVSENSWSLK